MVDNRHCVMGIGQQVLDNVPGKVHATDEIQQGVSRCVADNKKFTFLGRRQKDSVRLAIQVERRQTSFAQLT